MGTLIKDVQCLNPRTYNADLGFYIEYGLFDKLNVITKIPFKYFITNKLTNKTYFSDVLPVGNLSGVSNLEFDLKYALIDKNLKLAISLNTSWNTIFKDLDKGLPKGFDASSFGLTMHAGRINGKHYGFRETGFQK
jgi:hypothetical protein